MESSILRYKADMRTLAFIAVYFLLAYGGYLWYIQAVGDIPLWAIIGVSAAACSFCFSVSVIIHNTVHAPIFYNKKHNKIMQYVLSIAYGYSVSAFVPGHNFSHHKELETSKDIMRTSKARFKWHLLNQLFFFFIVTGGAAKYEFKWAVKMRTERPSWFRQWLSESILVMGIKIALLVINWKAALIFVWFPHLYALWALLGVNLWQHDGCDANHKYNHSRTFTGKVMNYLCFNNGYHGAHHDRPSLHWSLLPEFHERKISPYIHPNLEQKNMPLYFWKTYIYPGVRLNYDGSPYILPAAVEDEDWTMDVKVSDRKHKYDFGADNMSFDDLLEGKSDSTTKTKVGEEELETAEF